MKRRIFSNVSDIGSLAFIRGTSILNNYYEQKIDEIIKRYVIHSWNNA